MNAELKEKLKSLIDESDDFSFDKMWPMIILALIIVTPNKGDEKDV